MKNKEKINEVLRLMNENPELPVKIFVDNGCLCDDYAYTAQDISVVKIGCWIEWEEYVFDMYDDFIEHLECYLEMYTYEEAILKYPLEKVQKAIIIKTTV